MDTEPVNKLQYISERTSKNGKSKIAAQWYGFCKKFKRKVPLDKAYVVKEFLADLLKEVKRIALEGEKYFIGIPPGNAKSWSEFSSDLVKGPEMHYKQGKENTCMVYSCASALHYLGAIQTGSELYRKTNQIIKRKDSFEHFFVTAKEVDKQLQFCKLQIRNGTY